MSDRDANWPPISPEREEVCKRVDKLLYYIPLDAFDKATEGLTEVQCDAMIAVMVSRLQFKIVYEEMKRKRAARL